MARNPPVGTATKQELDEYFLQRDRALTEHVKRRLQTQPPETVMKSSPVEYVELFNSTRIQKDYGGYAISYEQGRGFKKRISGSSGWGPAGPDDIKIFKADAKAAARQNPDIAKYIASDPEFK